MVARPDQPRGRRAQASRSSAACTLFQGGFGACGGARKKAGAGNTPHFFLVTQPVTEAEEVAMGDEARGKRPAVSSARSLLVKDTYPVIAELELQGKTFFVCVAVQIKSGP